MTRKEYLIIERFDENFNGAQRFSGGKKEFGEERLFSEKWMCYNNLNDAVLTHRCGAAPHPRAKQRFAI
ncbi:hypothetical protein [Yeguia hominis]|uniref:Uncharacterized protein n=1 Tax=Yeguia hominis TaxID=2763662 RepID=A0A926HR92_9FIRM|nr:hypothetical protein [Yeguia hominis]MBC8532550.1 hypothetical protein [Yeguia hominis]